MLAIFLLIAISGLSGKMVMPYSWQNYKYGQLFENRVWYRHPVYGEMYINRDLLKFSQEVCNDTSATLIAETETSSNASRRDSNESAIEVGEERCNLQQQ